MNQSQLQYKFHLLAIVTRALTGSSSDLSRHGSYISLLLIRLSTSALGAGEKRVSLVWDSVNPHLCIFSQSLAQRALGMGEATEDVGEE